MDFSDIAALQAEIYGVLDAMEKQRTDYAVAKQVAEYDSDRRKIALAKATKSADGKSIAEKEMNARASGPYSDALAVLADSYAESQRVISRYYTLQSKMDALRSILSTQKTLAGL